MKLGLTGNSLNSIIIFPFSLEVLLVQFASFDGNLFQICWFVVCNGYVLVLMSGCYHFSVSYFLVSYRMGLSKLPNQHNVRCDRFKIIRMLAIISGHHLLSGFDKYEFYGKISFHVMIVLLHMLLATCERF